VDTPTEIGLPEFFPCSLYVVQINDGRRHFLSYVLRPRVALCLIEPTGGGRAKRCVSYYVLVGMKATRQSARVFPLFRSVNMLTGNQTSNNSVCPFYRSSLID